MYPPAVLTHDRRGGGIALQLYSLRQETARDFIGSLQAVRDAGHEAVGFAGPGEIRE